MADVTDRGQLILITALAIAVTLVALVLLLNTVIYAENLATRGADVGGQDAIEYRGAVLDGVGGVIDAENRRDYGKQNHVNENVTSAIERLDTLLGNQHLRRTELVEISNVSLTNGTLLRHPTDTGSFRNKSGAYNWTLASDVSATRGFVITTNRSVVNGTGTGNAFQVVLDNGTHQWIMYVYDNPQSLNVTVKNGSTDETTKPCTASDPTPTIDLTAGTFGGSPCPGLTFGEGIDGPYDISYVNGHRASGTYNLTVDRMPDDSAIQRNFDGPNSGNATYYAYAVYNASVDVRFQTDTLMFTDEIRVAPGEPS